MRIAFVAALAGLLSFGAQAQAQAPQTAPVPAPRMPATMSAPPARPVSPIVTPAAKPIPPGAAAPAAAPATTPAAMPATRVGATAGSRLDINSATAAQLDALPGIGPVRSAAIASGRPYTDLQELVTKKILSQGVLDVAKSGMALANINTSSVQDLEKTLPGVGGARAKAIVAGRPYATPDDLVTKKVLAAGVFAKMKDLVAY